MRVALMTSAPRWGGATLCYSRLACGLAGRGHATLVLARSGEIAERLRRDGVAADNAVRAIAAWRRLRGFDPDTVLADRPRDLRIAAMSGLGRPAVVYRYNRSEARPRSGPLDRILSWRVGGCIYQSRYAAALAAAHEPWLGRRPSALVPNGYDLERFVPDPEAGRAFRQRHRIDSEATVVLTLAELTRDKGFQDAIEALGLLGRAGPPPLYLAAGQGPLEAELRRRASAARVPFLVAGWLDGDEVIGALNAADLVVHPSPREISPNAVGEAMACGRPIVAADAGGTSELLGRDGAAGVLVPPRDPAALADALAALLADPERGARLGAAARRRVEAEFPLAHMIDGYERELGKLISA
jgi:glycosyltransferase involved in cell wall biosynthesis